MLGPGCYAAELADSVVENAEEVQLHYSFVSYLKAEAYPQIRIFSAVEGLQLLAFAVEAQGNAPDLTGHHDHHLETQI